MNSTLPEFPTSAAPVGAVSPATAPDLAGLLTGTGEPAADFATLIPPAGQPAASTANPAAPAAGTATVMAASQAVWRRGAGIAVTVPPAEAGDLAPATPSRFAEPRPEGAALVTPTPTEAAEAPVLLEAVPMSAEVPAELREQAFAFALAVLQGLAPENRSDTAEPTPAERGQDGGEAGPAILSPLDTTDALARPAGALTEPRLAVDGTVEIAAAKPSVGDGDAGAVAALEIEAELQLPGQPAIRFAAPASAERSPEKFAAAKADSADAVAAAPATAERNFEFASDKRLRGNAFDTGIAVAQSDATMPAAPIEEVRATLRPQDAMVSPVRADFQVAQAPVERISAPAPEPAGLPSFAGRAVETVTGVVEAQFAASMQRSGSVQLRLKFGSEDLSVRVALRDGVVQTDFQTDSAPLRAALEREWQAVAAASPAQMQRYLEPVFGPAPSAAGSSPSGGSSGDSRQQAGAHPQAQSDAQQHHAARAFPDSASPFSRRSLVGETFVPEAPASRQPAFLPTSLRLSALA